VKRRINWQDAIPNETNLDFDISNHDMLFSEYSPNSVHSKSCVTCFCSVTGFFQTVIIHFML
jgi:hypothetical protein